ncbi:MAG: extracellular solute-binding protein [Weeping tea tree witches'-broom phytoplasma]|uniref:extracellular solute-binding protein n=1 Tax=Candidatus Phytoplasma melaleucae TaxID=2982630 RepID=UPI00293AD2DC|nr:extracellular solute-binding protein [Weeping tea tree witches'-broom phytoplasma]
MKTKKKIIIIFLFLLSLIVSYKYVVSYSSNGKKIITLFNWGEYIDPQIIIDYNQKSDKFIIKQSFFSSNELAVNKIKSGDIYDIAILSEYSIEQLKDNYLEPIDRNKIHNNLQKETKNFQQVKTKLPKNIEKYIIPYFWGKLGFLYQKKKMTINNDNWEELLKKSDFKVSLYNNPFEGIFIGLKATKGNIGEASEEDIQKAEKWLLDFKQKKKHLSFITDQLLDNMKIPSEERYDISLVYSGDARYLMQENPNLEYYDFDSGTNIWIDNLVLPKGSNFEGAYDFINFLLQDDKIKQNALFIGYDSPYWENKELNNKLKLSIRLEDQIYRYNEDIKQKINDAWNKIYSYPRSQDSYLFILSFLIIIILVILQLKIYITKSITRN